MTKALNVISTIGALVMAATPLMAIPAFAHAQDTVQPQHIQVADLDLSRPADVARFNARVDVAAGRMCAAYETLSINAACRQAVRDEAAQKLDAVQVQQSAQAASVQGWTVAGR